MTPGPLHWELLLRARALDNQLYVVGAAPARNEASNYVAYGHSLIVDPWYPSMMLRNCSDTADFFWT